MKKGNNKGFTMVELLAVVLILGVISTIAIAGIRGILSRTKESYLDTQNKMVVLAGKTYYSDNRSKLPKVVGPVHEVTLQTLIDLNYIDPVKDAEGKECIISAEGKESKVYVQKIGKEDYKYSAYLYCSGEESGVNDSTAPTVKLDPMKTESTSNFPLTVKLSATDDNEILSYRYVIYKNGQEYKDTGYKNYTKEVPIKLKETGTYTIQAFAYDIVGNRGSITSEEYKIEILAPNCDSITVESTATGEWQNKNISFTVTSTDPSIDSWTAKVAYHDTVKNTTTTKTLANKVMNKSKNLTLSGSGEHTVIIEGYNSAGEKCSKQFSTYKIDTEKPTTPKLNNPTNGRWVNYDFSIEGTSTDSHSGIAYWQYSYDKKTWITYPDSATTNITTSNFENEQNKTVYIRVVDKVGNASEPASSLIRIDKTDPECVVTGCINESRCSDDILISTTTPNYVLVKGTCTDKGGSGCSYAYVSSYVFTPQWYEPEIPGSGIIYDNAGNVGHCGEIYVSIDDSGSSGSGNTGGGNTGGGNTGGGNTGGGSGTISSTFSGSWVCTECRSYCSTAQVQSGSTCLSPWGNVLVKVDVGGSCSGSSCNVSFSWTVRQGPETWIGSGYGVSLIVGGQSFALKSSSSTWGQGATNSGTVSGTFSKGSYSVSIQGNSQDPGYTASLGTLTLR